MTFYTRINESYFGVVQINFEVTFSSERKKDFKQYQSMHKIEIKSIQLQLHRKSCFVDLPICDVAIGSMNLFCVRSRAKRHLP